MCIRDSLGELGEIHPRREIAAPGPGQDVTRDRVRDERLERPVHAPGGIERLRGSTVVEDEKEAGRKARHQRRSNTSGAGTHFDFLISQKMNTSSSEPLEVFIV